MNKHDYYKKLADNASRKPVTRWTVVKWCLLAVLIVVSARWIITGILIAITDGLLWTPLLVIGIVLFIGGGKE